MNINDILKRRSIRKYTGDSISPQTITQLLQAAMAAPSARNLQPWHFIVVTDRKKLDQLAETHPYGKMLAHAPLAIAVVGEPACSEKYWIQDCSAATENILVAAVTLGLGAVWLGVTPREDRIKGVGDVLSIPTEFQVLSLISIGYPDEEKPASTKYSEERIHLDTW